MTKRLLEMQDYANQDEAETARLLGTMAPASPSEAAERRLYAKVCARRPPTPRLVRAVVLVTVFLISTAIFSATLARRWLVGVFGHAPGSSEVTQAMAEPKAPRAQPQQQKEILPDQPIAVRAAAVGTAEKGLTPPSLATSALPRGRASASSVARRRLVGATTPRPRSATEVAPATEEIAPAPPAEEAALVMAAVRALRREHNPQRAGALLDDYIERFPHGVLAEEALAVAIEAAVARQDGPTARTLAGRYLDRYPAGRFAGLARKASGATRP